MRASASNRYASGPTRMRARPRSTPRTMICAARSAVVIVAASNCAASCSLVRPRPSGSDRMRALRAMFVVTPPGCTVTARTPVPRNSWRSASVKPRTANFAAQYALWYGTPSNPYTLEVLTIAPASCSTRIGRNARVPFTTPWKLVSNSQSSSSGTAERTVAAAATRGVGDAARVPPLAGFIRRYQREVAQHGAQHHVQLHGGERRAEAAPGAAAERDPLVQVRPGVEEAGRVEGLRVRVHRLVVVHELDA